MQDGLSAIGHRNKNDCMDLRGSKSQFNQNILPYYEE